MTHVVDQSGSRIDHQRGADDQQYVALRHYLRSRLDHGDGLSEPDDVRPELLAPVVEVSEVYVAVAYIVDGLGRLLAAGFGDLPVKVDDLGGAGPLVEIVYVLCYDSDIEVLLQGGDDAVGLIWLPCPYVPAACIVEVQNQTGVAVPALDGGHFLHPVLFPHPVRVAEGVDSAFLAHSCSGEYCQFLHVCSIVCMFFLS